MKKYSRIIITGIFFIVLSINSRADSPITSTDFYTAYTDVAMMNTAKSSGKITEEISNYLLSKDNNIDLKMAVINALSWDFDGKKNAEIFTVFLKKKYEQTEKIDYDKMSAEDLCCLGYLTAMDNYFVVDEALKILNIAKNKNQKSYTIAIITAIVEAQKAMDTDWCRVWKVCETVQDNKKLKKDMRDDAIKVIFDYVGLYKDSCK
jgi:hypothetical protein